MMLMMFFTRVCEYFLWIISSQCHLYKALTEDNENRINKKNIREAL